MKTVVIVEWVESERNWGVRPDGCSLHLTQKDADTYVSDYWKIMPDSTPDEYSRPSGVSKLIEVSDTLFKHIEATKNGVRIWHHKRGHFGV